MSARRSAGTSFTLSPVMATMAPWAFHASTMRSFSSGSVRAWTPRPPPSTERRQPPLERRGRPCSWISDAICPSQSPFPWPRRSADDQVPGRQPLDHPAAHHLGLLGGQLAQHGHGPFGPVLLQEARDRVQDHDRTDHRGVLEVAGGRGHRGRHRQNEDHGVGELGSQHADRRWLISLDDLVRPERRQPSRGRLGSQAAVLVGLQRGRHHLGGLEPRSDGSGHLP